MLKTFRVALASSGPMVNSLVASGAIPESKATVIIADFNDGAQCGLTLESDFRQIPDDALPQEATRQKLNASAKALKCFRAIIDRKNFASHARVQQAAAIAEGILASLVVFYSDDGPMRSSAEGAASVEARNEDELEQRLEKQVKALERAMKP